jgi:hypothetical protein
MTIIASVPNKHCFKPLLVVVLGKVVGHLGTLATA